MEDGTVDEEASERPAAVSRPQLGERGELAQIGLALHGEHPLELLRAEPRGGEQLEEEVVAVAGLADERRLEPALELLPARGGHAVDRLVGPRRLGHMATRDEPFADEPVEHLIDVAEVELAPLRADAFLEARLELVAMALAAGEEREHGVVDRHRRDPTRA